MFLPWRVHALKAGREEAAGSIGVMQRALEVHGVQQHSAREHLHTHTSFVKIEDSRGAQSLWGDYAPVV